MISQGVANTLWACGKLNVSVHDTVAVALLRRALDVSSGMSEQEVANTLYAIAKLCLQASKALRTALLRQAGQVAGGTRMSRRSPTPCGPWQRLISCLVMRRAARCWSKQSASAAAWRRGSSCRCLMALRAWACGRGSRSGTPSLAAYARERPGMAPHEVTITDKALRQSAQGLQCHMYTMSAPVFFEFWYPSAGVQRHGGAGGI